ncbi:hypothetical protein GCM10010168_22290 [Actinoplanes ianthinogenes]|uniref:Uncharacterized protein n=1 Tax=Actinoplanes ianthinogenes TaxID=122358 RepID=A0ABM7M891_9ACTN|nr:hypothetical protein [Actinoplanes ianthinogenes]BCJ47870.1 hypothetical protein Aiant_85270 [Actinoplanes ianthinogenes]GGR04727.1 hypothetical protein GCM10010168_22290 [Actinoplanes ianthinogenes]
MRILFDDDVTVAFHLFSIESAGGGDRPELDGRAGQANGLCAAAIPGFLEFTTGLHTGDVPVRIEVHDREPDIDDVWQEVVEVSFRPLGRQVRLGIWGDAPIPLPDLDVRDYRVRLGVIGFDNEDEERTEPAERYLIQLWPAPPAPDRVVRQSSSTAAYWHQCAQKSPPPDRQERLEPQEQEEKFRQDDEARYWGGRGPANDRLRAVAPRAVGLAHLDRDLVDEIDAAGPEEQRVMAAWAARETCRRAGLAGQDWVAQALDALDRGDPPPAWFATFTDGFARWRQVPAEEITQRASLRPADAPAPEIRPEVSAIHAVVFAREPDPLEAALDTVRTAAAVIPGTEAEVIAAFRDRFGLPRD